MPTEIQPAANVRPQSAGDAPSFARGLGSACRRHGTHAGILILVAGAAFFTVSGSRPVVRQQEIRVLETAREMAESGDLLVPRLSGVPRFQKPPLAYWLALLGFEIAGEPSEEAGRAFSAICGVLTVLVVYAFGCTMGQPRLGFWAGLMLATANLFARGARRAETDVLMTFCMTAAFYAFWRAFEPAPGERRRPLPWILAAWASLGLAFLSKQVGPALVLACILFYLGVGRRWKEIGRVFHPLGILLFLAIATPWYAAVMRRNGLILDVFLREAEGAVEGLDHRPETPIMQTFFYFVRLVPCFAPWCIFLVPALLRAFRERRRERGTGFLLSWAGVIFFVLTLAGKKQEHYLMPAIPALALLTASWTEFGPERSVAAGRWISRLKAAAVAGGCLFWPGADFFDISSHEGRRTPPAFIERSRTIIDRSPVYFLAMADMNRPFLEFQLRRVIPAVQVARDEIKELLRRGEQFYVIVSGNPDPFRLAAPDAAIGIPPTPPVLSSAPGQAPLHLFSFGGTVPPDPLPLHP